MTLICDTRIYFQIIDELTNKFENEVEENDTDTENKDKSLHGPKRTVSLQIYRLTMMDIVSRRVSELGSVLHNTSLGTFSQVNGQRQSPPATSVFQCEKD